MKRRAFPGHGPEVEARYHRAGQWLLAALWRNEKALDWCQANGVPIRKAAGEGIDSAGGFLVPTELSRAILDLRDVYGAFRRRARIVPMASDNIDVPRRLGAASAYFVGENVALTETSITFDKIGLTARKIAALVRVSTELEEDAIVDIVDAVANEIAFAFAAIEDDCAFNGDGTSTYGQMRGVGKLVLDGNHSKAKVTAAGGHNTYLTLDATDLGSLVGAVRASAIPNAAWFVSELGFAQTFCRLAGASGCYMDSAVVDGELIRYFNSFPIVLTQKLPLIATTLTGQAMVVFGDMYSAGVLGQRRGITLARSADRYLDQDQLAIRATERVHAVIHDIGDNTNFGAIAALVAP